MWPPEIGPEMAGADGAGAPLGARARCSQDNINPSMSCTCKAYNLGLQLYNRNSYGLLYLPMTLYMYLQVASSCSTSEPLPH